MADKGGDLSPEEAAVEEVQQLQQPAEPAVEEVQQLQQPAEGALAEGGVQQLERRESVTQKSKDKKQRKSKTEKKDEIYDEKRKKDIYSKKKKKRKGQKHKSIEAAELADNQTDGIDSTPQTDPTLLSAPDPAQEPSNVDLAATMPGEIAEPDDQSEHSTSMYTTQLVENPEDPELQTKVLQSEDPEPLAGQEEIEFPTELHKTSTPEVMGHVEETHAALAPEPEDDFDFENRNFHSLDPKDYGIEFDEEEIYYEPPERDDTLPDLYRLMNSLEDGETDLEGRSEPPSLFTRPEHVPNYKKISELKLELEEEDIGPYMDDFDEGVRDDVLMIGSIALDEVQDEELRLRDEHIAYQEQEARKARVEQQQIIVREEEAKKRVARDLKDKRRIIKRRQELLQQKERLMMDRLHKAFRRAENQLISSLENRKGEVKTMYGDLTLSEGHYGGSKGRRWKVDWNKTPQPVQIKVKTLRGVKDKLPSGRYVLMVSMHNRLGGHIMRWSNLQGQQWGGTTLPVSHDGHFYNAEIKMEQSVFTVLPSKPSIRPGMVVVFELFLLRGATVPTDRVVAWGCFPVANAEFDVIEGKFKCPMLRGEMDPQIDKHEKIEELISSDVDNWLCNLYFEIVKLPRYLAGQKEYEVELQFSSGILSYPDRVNTLGEEYRDGEVPVPGSLTQLGSDKDVSADTLQLGRGQLVQSDTQIEGSTGDDDSIIKKPFAYIEEDKPKRPPSSASQGSAASSRPSSAYPLAAGNYKRPMTTLGSRAVHLDKKVKVEHESDSDDYDEEDVYLVKKNGGFFPVKGAPGMYYKQYLNNPTDEYHKKLYTLLPKTPALTKRNRRKRLTYLEELEEHKFAVKKEFDDKGHFQENSYEKLQYVSRQMMAELGLSQWRSREFWLMLTMFVLIFFIRLYLHYVGQWIFLTARSIPINSFNFLPYTVSLNYQPSLLQVIEETLVVLLGPFANIVAFSLFVFVSWICQKIFGMFPDIGSKFVCVYGIHAFLDPITILVVDCALQRWSDGAGVSPIGDFVKLYWHFDRAQGSGMAGIFITIVLYLFTMFATGTILYMYFLRLHNNGRMLDIYWRLRGLEDTFFMPYDLELSNYELSYIVKKAEQWRGEEGERKKVAVYDYIWEEEPIEDTVWDENGESKTETKEGKQEITTHVSVHTLHLDGLRELYRHWLRLPDGAIVEVFGDMAMAGLDKDLQNAMIEGATKLEDMGSHSSLTKVRGRQTAFTNAAFDLDDTQTSGNNPSRSTSIASLKKEL